MNDRNTLPIFALLSVGEGLDGLTTAVRINIPNEVPKEVKFAFRRVAGIPCNELFDIPCGRYNLQVRLDVTSNLHASTGGVGGISQKNAAQIVYSTIPPYALGNCSIPLLQVFEDSDDGALNIFAVKPNHREDSVDGRETASTISDFGDPSGVTYIQVRQRVIESGTFNFIRPIYNIRIGVGSMPLDSKG